MQYLIKPTLKNDHLLCNNRVSLFFVFEKKMRIYFRY